VEFFVGTSGWLYDWNEDSSLDWYVRYSGLNAIELNASFYRFPFRNQVLSWVRKGSSLHWSIKVHRYITHIKRLREDALDAWRRFKELFTPLDKYIDFYLFQLPPNFTYNDENAERIRLFARESGLGWRFAVEFRNKSWFNDEALGTIKDVGVTVVSVDEPGATWITSTNGIIYLRLHGRLNWYWYDYSHEELRELISRVMVLNPGKVYVFFNNDHWMLENARATLRILNEMLKNH